MNTSDLTEECNAYVAAPEAGGHYGIFARTREQAPALWSEPLKAWVMTRWPTCRACSRTGSISGP